MEVVKDAMARERASGEPGLNPTAASLLGFLDRGEMTGWDLVQLASTFIGDFWSLTQSQIYRELDTLERGGLVTGGAPGKRQRRPFALTGAGRGAFQEWLRQDPGPEHHRMPFLIKVSFAAQGDPAALALLLTRERRVHEERLAGYRAFQPVVAAAADPYVLATLSCGMFHEQAMLDWLDSLPAEWTAPATGRDTAQAPGAGPDRSGRDGGRVAESGRRPAKRASQSRPARRPAHG